MFLRGRIMFPILVLMFAIGCGDSKESRAAKSSSGMLPHAPKAAPNEAMMDALPDEKAQPANGGKVAPKADDTPMERKIIYSANVEITVKDIDQTRKEVDRLVEEHKGYVAKSETTGTAGTQRTTSWTLKIPSDKFRVVVNALAALGVPLKNSSDSQDVTEEFVDVAARVKNLKNEEEVLNKMLKESVGRLDELLKLREQIKSIRGDIERAEGRMKYQTTTKHTQHITLLAREEFTFVPPTPVAPDLTRSFSEQIGDTFTASFTKLENLGKSLTLIVIALAPWSPLLLLGVFGTRVLVKRMPQSQHRQYAVATRVPETAMKGTASEVDSTKPKSS